MNKLKQRHETLARVHTHTHTDSSLVNKCENRGVEYDT